MSKKQSFSLSNQNLITELSKNPNALSEMMLILTDGKTSEFNSLTFLNSLTPKTLEKAVEKNNLQLVQMHLIAGVPEGLRNLLAIAIEEGYTEMRQLLLEHNIGIGDEENAAEPLFTAIEKEDIDSVTTLLKYGVPIKEKEGHLSYALYIYYENQKEKKSTSNITNIIDTLIASNPNCIDILSISRAIENGDLDMVKRLVSLKKERMGEQQLRKEVENWEVNAFEQCNEITFTELAIKSKNPKLLDYLLYECADAKRIGKFRTRDGRLIVDSTIYVFGMETVLKNDDVNMMSVLVHHGVQLSDRFEMEGTGYTPEIKEEIRGNIASIYRCNGWEKRYQMMQQIFEFEDKLNEQKQIQKITDQKNLPVRNTSRGARTE